jgi:hypothetical protein
MTRGTDGAELLNRLCDLRDAYKRRGPDDREASMTVAVLLDHVAEIWECAPLASEPNA